MKAIKWKTLITTGILCLLPILLGVLLWDKLPEQVAVHFNLNNEPDGFASKGFAVFCMPLIILLIHIIFCIGCDLQIGKKQYIPITKWIIPMASIVVNSATFAYAMGFAVEMGWVAGIFALFIIIAVVLNGAKSKRKI